MASQGPRGERSSLATLLLFFFNLILKIFIYLFMFALGLCCCPQAFSSCGKQRLLSIAGHGLLIVAASLVGEHGLYV